MWNSDMMESNLQSKNVQEGKRIPRHENPPSLMSLKFSFFINYKFSGQLVGLEGCVGNGKLLYSGDSQLRWAVRQMPFFRFLTWHLKLSPFLVCIASTTRVSTAQSSFFHPKKWSVSTGISHALHFEMKRQLLVVSPKESRVGWPHQSMGDLQEPIDSRYLPYMFGLFERPKFQGMSPHFFWPEIRYGTNVAPSIGS